MRKSKESNRSKKLVASQLLGLQSEVALLTSKIDDRLPHLAFAQDLESAREQYGSFQAGVEEMRAEMATMRETFSSTVSTMRLQLLRNNIDPN